MSRTRFNVGNSIKKFCQFLPDQYPHSDSLEISSNLTIENLWNFTNHCIKNIVVLKWNSNEQWVLSKWMSHLKRDCIYVMRNETGVEVQYLGWNYVFILCIYLIWFAWLKFSYLYYYLYILGEKGALLLRNLHATWSVFYKQNRRPSIKKKLFKKI